MKVKKIQFKEITSLFNTRNIIIVHPYNNWSVLKPRHGGTRLILEQIKYLKLSKYNIEILSLNETSSLTSIIQKMLSKEIIETSSKYIYKLSTYNEEIKWYLNLLKILFHELLSKADFTFKIYLKRRFNKMKSKLPAIVLYNYPFGVDAFYYIRRKYPVKIFIYEHNIEWKFFEDKLGKNLISRILVYLLRKIELSNLRKADYIFCVNKKDRETLIKEGGIPPEKIGVWVPLIIGYKKNMRSVEIPSDLKRKLTGKFIIGFVGSKFYPNIVAVENIISIARKVPNDVAFLIIGSVSEAFTNRKDIPENVIFVGYVDNIDQYLALCDAFINPKTTSDTGIEIKMFDYLKFEKPIISTKIGARGFEEFKNVIIVHIKEIPKIINILKKLKNKYYENKK